MEEYRKLELFDFQRGRSPKYVLFRQGLAGFWPNAFRQMSAVERLQTNSSPARHAQGLRRHVKARPLRHRAKFMDTFVRQAFLGAVVAPNAQAICVVTGCVHYRDWRTSVRQ